MKTKKEKICVLISLLIVISIPLSLTMCGDDKDEPTQITLEASPSGPIAFEATGNENVTITITTNATTWEVNTPGWIITTKDVQGKILTVNVADNTGDERSGDIEITAANATPVKIKVTQKATEVVLLHPKLMYYLPFDGDCGDYSNYQLYTQEDGVVGYLPGVKGRSFNGDNSGRISLAYKSVVNTELNFADTLMNKNIDGITIASWVKIPDGPAGANNVIFSIQNAYLFWGTTSLFVDVGDEDENPTFRVTAHLRNKQPDPNTASPAVYEKLFDNTYFNSWHHVVFRYDCATSTVTLFMDGEVVDTKVMNNVNAAGEVIDGETLGQIKFFNLVEGTRVSVGSFYFDGIEDWAPWFRGQIDEFRFYYTSLPDDEITGIYNDEKPN